MLHKRTYLSQARQSTWLVFTAAAGTAISLLGLNSHFGLIWSSALFYRREEFVEGLGEERTPSVSKLVRHLLHEIPTWRRFPSFCGRRKVFGKLWRSFPMIAEASKVAGGIVSTCPADQFFDVQHIAIGRVLVLVLAQSTRWVCAPLAARVSIEEC